MKEFKKTERLTYPWYKGNIDEDRKHTHIYVKSSLQLLVACTKSVQKVPSHFEYLENRSHRPDVTWQPVRGDLTVHP